MCLLEVHLSASGQPCQAERFEQAVVWQFLDSGPEGLSCAKPLSRTRPRASICLGDLSPFLFWHSSPRANEHHAFGVFALRPNRYNNSAISLCPGARAKYSPDLGSQQERMFECSSPTILISPVTADISPTPQTPPASACHPMPKGQNRSRIRLP
ncbi:hypothetical protein N656DRAFT_505901 [Canariomyces notabilis]|uniref:Uncharacterized protein n=1 Tax=Canariomyces notabilis TaxID=2074819 RepID=A0AAN6QCB3_9PEZI|nr:hypothetical protein N656DRAFT_505901 [Canariomyces arenarius]